jgi:hypothetical protein
MDETIYAAVDRGPVAQERPTVFDVSQRSGRGKREPTCIGSCHVGPVEVARGQRPQPAQVPTLRTSTGAGYLDTAHWLACIASGALISGVKRSRRLGSTVHTPTGGARAFRTAGVPREGRVRFGGGPPGDLRRTTRPDALEPRGVPLRLPNPADRKPDRRRAALYRTGADCGAAAGKTLNCPAN